jgi:hypothetical protein
LACQGSDFFALKRYRHGIESVNTQLESMGAQHLKARTNQSLASQGFVKVYASLLAIIYTN